MSGDPTIKAGERSYQDHVDALLAAEPMLRWFAFDHLPAALQAHSAPYHDLARRTVLTLPRNAERTVALRKLLEAKDAAVRASLDHP